MFGVDSLSALHLPLESCQQLVHALLVVCGLIHFLTTSRFSYLPCPKLALMAAAYWELPGCAVDAM